MCPFLCTAELSTGPTDCITKVDRGTPSQENAIESVRPNTLSSTDNSDKVSLNNILTTDLLDGCHHHAYVG